MTRRRAPKATARAGGTTAQGPDLAIRALAQVGAAFASMLEEFPGIRRSADVERALGLDRPLAWRVFRVATSTDPAAALNYLPTANQVQRVATVAEERGARAESAERVRAAWAEFEACVKEVAGDFDALCALVSAHSRRGLERIDQRVRRQAFRGNAHLWGMHCRTSVCAVILLPRRDGPTLDAFTVRGWVDLETARADRPLVLHSRFGVRSDLPEAEPPRVGEMRVMEGFADPGALDLRTVEIGEGRQETHLMAPGVGRAGRSTVFVGAPIARVGELGDGEAHRLGGVQCTPAAALHYEFIAPAGWSDPSRMSLAVYARPNAVHRAGERRSIDLVRSFERPEFIADVESAPPTPDVPRWPELVRAVLRERLGDAAEGMRLDTHRVRMAYPMLHAFVSLEVCPRTGGPTERPDAHREP